MWMRLSVWSCTFAVSQYLMSHYLIHSRLRHGPRGPIASSGPPDGRPRNRPGSFRRRVRSRSLPSDSLRWKPGACNEERERAKCNWGFSGRSCTHEKFYFSVHDGRRAILRESRCRSFFAEALKAPVWTPTDSRGPWPRRTQHRIVGVCGIDSEERNFSGGGFFSVSAQDLDGGESCWYFGFARKGNC